MKKTLLTCFVATVSLIAIPGRGQGMGEVDRAQKPAITFVELGSVKCIPCRQMQAVMKAIEEKYAGQVRVVFYDVWKQDQQHYAQEFKIRVIPTQVFLDRDGQELMRHEGFFPEKAIDAFLQTKGLKPMAGVKD